MDHLLWNITNVKNIFNMVWLGSITNVFEYTRVKDRWLVIACLYSHLKKNSHITAFVFILNVNS